MRFISCISTLHIFHSTSSNISSGMPSKIHKISQKISIWIGFLPFELRTFFGKAVFNGSASGLSELSTGSTDSSVKLVPGWTWDGFTTSGLRHSFPETNPHQGDKPTSPQAMVNYIHVWGFMKIFFKKVHCFEFRAAASSGDWSCIKGATCPNQIFRKYHDFWQNMLSTSGLNSSSGEDLEDLEYQMRLGRGNMWRHKGCMMQA